MPIVFDGSHSRGNAFARVGAGALGRDKPHGTVTQDYLEIGLVNSMPDTALRATEQQFMDLVVAGAGATPVRLHLYALPEIPRGETAAAHMRESYADISELGRTPLDALIVTGNEPRAASLTDEPYWKSLTKVIDWAEHNTTSTIFSCLAAHAAVLHLDGVRRRPLADKCTGVFTCRPIQDHELLGADAQPLLVPHSRWNDLAESDLAAHGYSVLTRAKDAGVDMFVKRWKSLFVFFQGHPEYHADSLAREYRRDLGRTLRGEAARWPSLPKNYFGRQIEAELAGLAARARTEDPAQLLAQLLAQVPTTLRPRPSVTQRWRTGVVPVWRNWLNFLSLRKG